MKRLIIFSLILALSLAIFGINQSVEDCYALSNAFIDVIGSAKKEVEPNVANIRFGINAISENIRDGQNKINSIIENIESAICENKYGDCELIIEYSSCYPKFNNGVTNYYFNTNVVAKTSNIENVNELIAVACDNGATSYYNVSYELDNYEDVYQEVLLLAKDNAYKKACGINSDISQVGFKEMSLFNYCNDSKIVVEANIRARYEVLNSEDENQQLDNNQNDSELNSEIIDNDEFNDFEIDKEDYVEPIEKNPVDNYEIPEVYEDNSDAEILNDNENNLVNNNANNSQNSNSLNDNTQEEIQTDETVVQIDEVENIVDSENDNVNIDPEVKNDVEDANEAQNNSIEDQDSVENISSSTQEGVISDEIKPNEVLNENNNESIETNQEFNKEDYDNTNVNNEINNNNNENKHEDVQSDKIELNGTDNESTELLDDKIIDSEKEN